MGDSIEDVVRWRKLAKEHVDRAAAAKDAAEKQRLLIRAAEYQERAKRLEEWLKQRSRTQGK